ncbi:homogentisate solanesyltransferase, chloroplastic [Morus notabilis]|uniref:homogentisate solanesyltransferase, chloroplastic n=1 Tax=Morus notabilis TaxID=981085 RepID=UPI000CED222C|nr:homogentisate solanesyltransferase, chloroplastic [Morus notabilis]
MELSISHSSLRLPAIIPQRCKASSHEKRLFSIKPTTKNIKSSDFPSNCSTANKLILPLGLYGERKLSKSLLYGQHRRTSSTIRASAEAHESANNSDGTFAKFSKFGSALYKFLRIYALSHTIVSTVSLFARVLVENPHLFKWSLVLKAFPGLIAMTLANAYYIGINQIYDADIDRVNKPYLPIPAGELSLKQAWILVISFAVGALSILRLMNADWITTSIFCFGLFLAHFYSAPPLRFKQSPIATSIVNPLNAGVVHNLGLIYATRASLGLPFVWNPSTFFIVNFITPFFLAITNLKDLTDMEGDSKHNIRTLPTIYGPRKITFFFVGMLLTHYAAAALAGILLPKVFNPYVMAPAHAILGLLLFLKTRELDKANYTVEASETFYKFIWKILLLEFVIFPFI